MSKSLMHTIFIHNILTTENIEKFEHTTVTDALNRYHNLSGQFAEEIFDGKYTIVMVHHKDWGNGS